MARGLDLTTPVAFSLAAGLSRTIGLNEDRTAAAVEICGDSGITFLVLRTSPISHWKGLASAHVALGCVNGVFLASRGVTGPKYVIEGPNGLAQALDQPIRIEWDRAKLDCFDRLALKQYNSAVPTQSSIYCMLELRKHYAFDPALIERIDVDVFQNAYDFTGGGSFGSRTDVHTKEEADHSIPYLLAVAALDGDVQPVQLEPSRIEKGDVQGLLRKVKIKPDAGFTARYPDEFPCRVTVKLKGGRSYSNEVKDYPGYPSRPYTWEDVVKKFNRLVEGRADTGLCREIKDIVHSFENHQVCELMKLLGRVKVAEGPR
jgi:2-methylcitrate dehydratase